MLPKDAGQDQLPVQQSLPSMDNIDKEDSQKTPGKIVPFPVSVYEDAVLN